MILMVLILMPIFLLLAAAFSTLLERNIFGLIQMRFSPNKNILAGIMQPLMDGLKLMMKMKMGLIYSNKILLMMFSLFIFPLSLIFSLIICFNNYLFFSKFSMLWILLLSTTFSFFMMMISFFSKSKYSGIGSQRIYSQMISYEIVMSFFMMLISIILMTYLSFNLFYLNNIKYVCIKMPFMLVIWLFIILAEMNRTPFDSVEGESEIVSGFNTELSSLIFVYIFLSEYIIMSLFSFLTTMIFCNNFFYLFCYIMFLSLIFSIRSLLPRMRYDKMMLMFWNFLLPIILLLLVIIMFL
uniref:NADH dehydrogenase subunit 1 n=1 Tax=Intoshia linei TaxID=1819745 RepID=UPI001EDFB2E8|nr:NADH dehydrogenase subunit 1 [Intoshia linei]UIB41613.1 NADH dehydrogenase subunit 1 [Intoshia linei]